mmetsp:Transcript_5582/g.11626  ORF Transcript_5582/g.11626 Transcript_5582/m.11626 type:complete len:603 (-) Transcript_5582:119-1927(-)
MKKASTFIALLIVVRSNAFLRVGPNLRPINNERLPIKKLTHSTASSTKNVHRRSTLLAKTSAAVAPLPRPNSRLFSSAAVSPILSQPGRIASAFLIFISSFLSFSAKSIRKILWPKANPDNKVLNPLPDGTLGCPFFGHWLFSGDEEEGPGAFWRNLVAKFGNVGIFKTYFMGRPMAVVSGSKNLRNILDREFKSSDEGGVEIGVFARTEAAADIFGSDSMLTSQDKLNHKWLRRLVGQAMSPLAVSASIPQLVKAADDAVDDVFTAMNSDSGIVRMEDVCTKFTLDIAWRQILGLDLSDEEVFEFRSKVDEWIGGMLSPAVMLLPDPHGQKTKSYKARKYLDNIILEKMRQLEINGPDDSTLSAMVYAIDEESDEETGEKNRRLSKKQVMDNALLLILAGSETSASTLTNIMLFLGLYPEVYSRLKDEQKQNIMKHGHTLTGKIIDENMPYLDSVIRESMRIKPIQGGAQRTAKSTIVIDGKQIPKGWPIMAQISLTHRFDPVTRATDGEDNMNIYKGFKPERWLDKSTRPSSDWVALGHGPRYCLGANLAMAEMKVFMSTIIRAIDFDLVNSKTDIKWKKMSIIPKPKDGTEIYPRVQAL